MTSRCESMKTGPLPNAFGRALLWVVTLATVQTGRSENFTLTILHANDLHAHVEPTKIQEKFYGGYARLATLVQKYRASDTNVLVLNGGDTFQGTLYFNVYEGLADLAFMNVVGFDAAATGNHEFDRGPGPLGRFASLAKFPILAANLDVSAEPALAGRIKAFTVLRVHGQKIGVVGAVTPVLPDITSPGPNLRMLDLASSCQNAIDTLRAEGIDKILMVTHVGYEEELDLARKLRGVDVIIGGHSHTLLGDLKVDGFASSSGPYPTVVRNADGDTALVVQAYEWGKVLGRIKVEFDSAGRVARWTDAAPILVDESIAEDLTIKTIVTALQKPIAEVANQVIGGSANGVSRTRTANGESPMGTLIADSMLEAMRAQGAVLACANAGGVRASFEPGTITYGLAISVQPFNNTLVLLDLSGAELITAIEHGVRSGGGMLLMSSASSYRVDGTKPPGQQVLDVVIAGEKLDPAKTYRVGFNSFTAGGGDAHQTLKNAKGKRTDTGILDIDAFIDYLKKHSPLEAK